MMTRTRTRTTAVLVAGLLGSALLPGAPSSAQELAAAAPSVSPGKAPAGATVTVSGTGCLFKDAPGSLNFGFAAQVSGTAVDLSPLDGNKADANGNWSATMSIPTHVRGMTGERHELRPGPIYVITTVCSFPEVPSDLWISYPAAPFEVTSSAASISPSDPTPATPTGTHSTPTSATAAVPIPTTPRFTG
jgi:hypothetical protein